jgi:hypothetical protein
MKMRFRSDNQRKAVMAKLRGRDVVNNYVDICRKKDHLKPTKMDYIYRIDDGCVVRLFDTDIAKLNARDDTITLDSGGYRTTTTKDRMNRALTGTPYMVYQKKGDWFVRDADNDKEIPFTDGMSLKVPSEMTKGLKGIKLSKEAPIGENRYSLLPPYRHQTDAWRGYDVPTNAVAGSSDTGTWSDSPCPTDKVSGEIQTLKDELRKEGIGTKDKVTPTSNVFCAKRWVVLNKASDYERAKPIIKKVMDKSSYLHEV